jgi:hypothetical protein
VEVLSQMLLAMITLHREEMPITWPHYNQTCQLRKLKNHPPAIGALTTGEISNDRSSNHLLVTNILRMRETYVSQ